MYRDYRNVRTCPKLARFGDRLVRLVWVGSRTSAPHSGMGEYDLPFRMRWAFDRLGLSGRPDEGLADQLARSYREGLASKVR